MKIKIKLYRRLTRKYNTAYSHLDDWGYLGDAVEKSPDNPWVYDANGESASAKVIVTVAPEVLNRTPAKVVEQAIEDNYAASCTCEHDCCGHWFQYAMAYRVKPREWSVIIRKTMNI